MIRAGSIRQGISWLVVGLSVLMCVFTALILSLTHIKQLNQDAEVRAQEIASVVAEVTSRYLLFDDVEGLNSYLGHFAVTPFLEHLHVYESSLVGDQPQLHYYASYNREGLAPIPVQTELLPGFSGVRSHSNYIEVAQPITIEDEQLGFVYLRVSRDSITATTWRTVVTASISTVVAALFTWIVAARVRSRLMRPLDQTVGIIQRISRNRDYSTRLPELNLLELQRLGSAFNTMLGRVEQHLERQQRAERQANDLNAELERQVQQRTNALREANAELMNTLEKLHQFQRQMIETEKMSSLGDLIAGVAHEINTPVGLVLTSTSILQDKLEFMQQKFDNNTMSRSDFERFMEASSDNLGLIQRNIERTAELINQFRQLAMDQFAEDPRDIRIYDFCQTAIDTVTAKMPELAAIDIRLECPHDLHISCRSGPLQHVLSQLLQNSIEHGFVERARGQITLTVERIDTHHVKLIYRDNGSGIPEELGRRVFEPFVTQRRRQGSTGLGLHLVYNLVTQALSGSIEVNSKAGRYTEFVITIVA
ncbi:Sporulation kinase E [Pseudidiomarina piscicola]|uniref:histidine kinase n=1 Tax=Pseudidiomarina piscicola TaxID=2614830 RepID=A0A6S6WM48_9GAMM|nr:HAMP domain-containing sensor histidine kinase [Pseudidiomarina piscicola]CAB0151096.1 Sporulation kinase E [Pseudidiomarina piscicola]VZT40604.1 Sporulation kinase E [Pseudomonas aeruginosa]